MTFFPKSYIIRNMSRGIIRHFIVFEGIDGSGTTTLLNRVSARLTERNIRHRCDAEPTSSAVGRRLRSMLQTGNPADPLYNTAMSALFSLDRALHLYGPDGIAAATADGTIILCDRYLFSTIAYQGIFGDPEEALSFNETFPLPEYLFFLDRPASDALKRIEKRGQKKEIYETADYLDRIARRYRQIISRFSDEGMKILTLDAGLSPDTLEKQVFDSLSSESAPE